MEWMADKERKDPRGFLVKDNNGLFWKLCCSGPVGHRLEERDWDLAGKKKKMLADSQTHLAKKICFPNFVRISNVILPYLPLLLLPQRAELERLALSNSYRHKTRDPSAPSSKKLILGNCSIVSVLREVTLKNQHAYKWLGMIVCWLDVNSF